jgi:hypothetical protein
MGGFAHITTRLKQKECERDRKRTNMTPSQNTCRRQKVQERN